ncbi:hypothetical protein CLTEP_27330 [Clostridium tepidiprofundi DSM 19306]|uniref:Uncharacterized protein n=1 Tax=Clostridium tepidiprofundi DSM 19306 TaxID=1121338 RepID=A0A151ANR6_9CLOT|nr:hypothetical protein [Clostridium tepidiprofundi]KYH29047.1 hypothetical protein CLTEP_27330 [Clostridium tepidiprofundi DSM 19306]
MKFKKLISVIIISIVCITIGYQYKTSNDIKNELSGLYSWNIYNLDTMFKGDNKRLINTKTLKYSEVIKYIQKYSDRAYLTAVLPSSWNIPLIRCLNSIENDFNLILVYMDRNEPIEEINKVKNQAIEKITFLENLFDYIYKSANENYKDKYYELENENNDINKKVLKELNDFIESHSIS